MKNINISDLTKDNFLELFKDKTMDDYNTLSKSQLQTIYGIITSTELKLKGNKEDYIQTVIGYIKASKTAIAFKNMK